MLQSKNSLRQQLSQLRMHEGVEASMQRGMTPLHHRCSYSQRKLVASWTCAVKSPDAGPYERSQDRRVTFLTRLLAIALAIWTSLQRVPGAISRILALKNELVLPSPPQVIWQTIRVLLYAGMLLVIVSTYDRGFQWLFTR